MRCTKDFRPARGVTLANSFRHIAAIEEAVVRDITKVDPSQRAGVLRIIRAALKMALNTINRLLEESGDNPASQKEEAKIYMMMRKEGETTN